MKYMSLENHKLYVDYFKFSIEILKDHPSVKSDPWLASHLDNVVNQMSRHLIKADSLSIDFSEFLPRLFPLSKDIA